MTHPHDNQATTTWRVSDGHDTIELEAASAQAAAEEFAEGWEPERATWWLTVSVWRLQDGEVVDQQDIKVPIHPAEPRCVEPTHDWQPGPGGLEEDPGVFGHGGGVVIITQCRHCGLERREDTWAQDPATGEQGLRSIAYGDQDDSEEE